MAPKGRQNFQQEIACYPIVIWGEFVRIYGNCWDILKVWLHVSSGHLGPDKGCGLSIFRAYIQVELSCKC